eukprot:CAMPEP_0179033176 /NCGR_PEP_ID=MMETSP0796-20121207/11970_1 /TAXON_ID=73915 /ORGANISM="Pyrodinium bahamense, Strain pbaha01" /LENGTH=113 /DNA_ID=CAMNT_0020729429 /DNA_START=1 /DNA_END=339 /DNA_ORIENTATION=-
MDLSSCRGADEAKAQHGLTSAGLSRVRLHVDIAVAASAKGPLHARSRRLLVGVPVHLRTSPVSCFSRHLCSRLGVSLTSLTLAVDGFALHPLQRLCDALRDGDVVEAHVEGGA